MTANIDGPVTTRQESYLRSLTQNRNFFDGVTTPAECAAALEEWLAAGRTQGAASDLLDKALRAPFFPREVIPADERDFENLRRRAADWALFGLGVSREDTIARIEDVIAEGTLTKAQCYEYQRRAYRTPHPDEKTPLPLNVIEGMEKFSIHEGHFAVMYEDVLRFYRIYSPATGVLRGVAVIRRYSSSNERAITPAEALAVIATINEDWDAAAYRFADEFTCCFICGKVLTDQVSRLVSVGPTCRGFSNHTGLRTAAADVDANPARRAVFRVLREWAVEQGFGDPRTREDRAVMGNITASALASAWSGIPGVIDLPADKAVALCKAAASGEDIDEALAAGMRKAPADTLGLLMEFKVLSSAALQLLTEHPNAKVREQAMEYFMAALA